MTNDDSYKHQQALIMQREIEESLKRDKESLMDKLIKVGEQFRETVSEGRIQKDLTVLEFEEIYHSHRPSSTKFKKEPFWIPKGWGGESICFDYGKNVSAFYGEEIKTVKVLYFEKNKKCSLHYHQEKFEVFHMLFGKLFVNLVWNGVEYDVLMVPGDSICIDRNLVHQMTGLEETNILLEISTQDYDHDSYRIKKGD